MQRAGSFSRLYGMTITSPTERKLARAGQRDSFPFLQALALKYKGLSNRQIALQLGVANTTVDNAFAKHRDLVSSQDHLTIYESGRAQLLSAAEGRILASVLEHDLTKTALRDKIIALGVIYDKGRLERGATTQNVGVVAHLIEQSDRALFAKRGNGKVVPSVDTETGDTPTTPQAGGTGGETLTQGAVVTRDLAHEQNQALAIVGGEKL